MDKRFNEILSEMGIYLIFLFFLYYDSFTNYSNSSFTYNQLFRSTFVFPQNPNEKGLNDVILFSILFMIRSRETMKQVISIVMIFLISLFFQMGNFFYCDHFF